MTEWIAAQLIRHRRSLTLPHARRLARLGLYALALLALLVVLTVNGCSAQRQKSEQGKQDSRSASAITATAREAAAKVIARAEDEATVDDLVAAAIEEIDNAPNDQAAGAAARAAICRLPDYRDDPAC